MFVNCFSTVLQPPALPLTQPQRPQSAPVQATQWDINAPYPLPPSHGLLSQGLISQAFTTATSGDHSIVVAGDPSISTITPSPRAHFSTSLNIGDSLHTSTLESPSPRQQRESAEMVSSTLHRARMQSEASPSSPTIDQVVEGGGEEEEKTQSSPDSV